MKGRSFWIILFKIDKMRASFSKPLPNIKKFLENIAYRQYQKRTRLELLSPEEVYEALINNSKISKWLTFISNHYRPPHKRILLIYPCTATKPYSESRSYRALFKTLSALGEKRKEIHLMTISEPFGLIPEEFQNRENWNYDCPGLFEWWCNKNNQVFSKEKLNKCIEILAEYTAKFFEKAHREKCYSKIIAFVRTYTSQLEKKEDHTHRRIIERAVKISGIKVDILPPKTLVSRIVKERGRFAWDMYGVAHPLAQDYLLNYIRRILNDN
jgi:archaeosine synthase